MHKQDVVILKAVFGAVNAVYIVGFVVKWVVDEGDFQGEVQELAIVDIQWSLPPLQFRNRQFAEAVCSKWYRLARFQSCILDVHLSKRPCGDQGLSLISMLS